MAINDRREAFVELLAAHSGMAHNALNQDIDGFLAARQEFDRARARVNLYGPSRPLAEAVEALADVWGKITRNAAQTGGVPGGAR